MWFAFFEQYIEEIVADNFHNFYPHIYWFHSLYILLAYKYRLAVILTHLRMCKMLCVKTYGVYFFRYLLTNNYLYVWTTSYPNCCISYIKYLFRNIVQMTCFVKVSVFRISVNNYPYIVKQEWICQNGHLVSCVKLRVAHAPGIPGTFSPPPRISDPGMHHGTYVTHVP